MEHFEPRDLPDMTLVCVPPSFALETWPLVEEMICGAYERVGLVLPADTDNHLARGTLLLWLALDADLQILCAAITALIDADCRVCEIRAAAGTDMRRWLPFHLELERFALAEGCAKVRLRGRRGWLRVLSGYRLVGEFMEKDL